MLETLIKQLKMTLAAIVKNDTNYEVRYQLILSAMMTANKLNLKTGVRIDPDEPEWPVYFIQLPTGKQVSWHCEQYPDKWDGHSTEEKFTRIQEFIEKYKNAD